jgi:hypothetical protein
MHCIPYITIASILDEWGDYHLVLCEGACRVKPLNVLVSGAASFTILDRRSMN